ncbi:MAG: DUF2190 family protein [Bryobacterales bacterium]|nr:DUF2190 family protein [Bryobacterales bacterium]
MKNFIQAGNTLTVAAPANVSSGDLVVVGNIIGVAAYTALSTEEVEVETVGVFELPKITTDDVAVGDALYWNSSQSKLTATAGTGSKPLVGYAVAAAGNGVTTVKARLVPTLQTGPS